MGAPLPPSVKVEAEHCRSPVRDSNNNSGSTPVLVLRMGKDRAPYRSLTHLNYDRSIGLAACMATLVVLVYGWWNLGT